MKEESIVGMTEKEANKLYPEMFSIQIGKNFDLNKAERLAYIAGRSKGIEREKELEEGINILRELAHIKIYKDKNGKDEYYEKNQPELWKKAIAYLNSYVNK